MTLKLNSRAILADVIAAFGETCSTAADATATALELTVYPYPRATVRSTGQIATSPRNIVDSGDLKNSQYFARVDIQTYAIGYTAGHAIAVRFGETTKSGTHKPGRDWFSVAIGDGSKPTVMDFPATFKTNYERRAA
jgi:hypothetical protein